MDLAERAAASVAPEYVKALVVPEGTLALVMTAYFDGDSPSQLAPPLVAIPRAKLEAGHVGELFLPYEPEGFEGEELDGPEVDDNADVLALLAALNADWDEGRLLDTYLEALARHLHEAFGLLVIPDASGSSTSERDVLRGQLSDAEWADWEANDWLPRDRGIERRLAEADVLLSHFVGPYQTAAIYRREDTIFGTAHFGGGGRGLDGPIAQLGEDPMVVGGLLPDGAVSVAVQDLFDVWHDGVVGEGAWLCVLPHPARGGLPPVRFRDAAGRDVRLAPQSRPEGLSFGVELSGEPLTDAQRAQWQSEYAAEQRRVLATAGVPPLWPAGAPAPALDGWGWSGDDDDAPADSLDFAHGALRVSIATEEYPDEPAGSAREQLERQLQSRLGDRAAGRAVLEASETSLPGTIDGEPVTFALIAGGGRWVAVWVRRRDGLTVTVTGEGIPPQRLEMVRIGVRDVRPTA
jgi:hypothetical protein